MSIFQAYCFEKYHDSDLFVLTFSNPIVADEWWRAITERPDLASLFTRVNPQLYTYTKNILHTFLSDPRASHIVSEFRGRVYIKMIDNSDKDDGFPILQRLNLANAFSGSWIYIRSVTAPHIFWYYGDQTKSEYKPITVSATLRTRFLMIGENMNTGNILIGEDHVILQIENTKQQPLYVYWTSMITNGDPDLRSTFDKNLCPTRVFRIRNQAFVLPDGHVGYNDAIDKNSLADAVWEFV